MVSNGDILLACILIIIGFAPVIMLKNKRQAERINKVYDNREIVLQNLYRLQGLGYIPLSIEKLKLVDTYLRDLRRLMNEGSYADCPELDHSNKYQIVDLLNKCANMYIDVGVPSHRIYEFVPPSQFEPQ